MAVAKVESETYRGLLLRASHHQSVFPDLTDSHRRAALMDPDAVCDDMASMAATPHMHATAINGCVEDWTSRIPDVPGALESRNSSAEQTEVGVLGSSRCAVLDATKVTWNSHLCSNHLCKLKL